MALLAHAPGYRNSPGRDGSRGSQEAPSMLTLEELAAVVIGLFTLALLFATLVAQAAHTVREYRDLHHDDENALAHRRADEGRG
jgi:hypothetical protein